MTNENEITPKDCLNVIIEGSENVFRDIGCSNPEEKLIEAEKRRLAEKKDNFVPEKIFPYKQIEQIDLFYRNGVDCDIGLVPTEFYEIFLLIRQYGKRINLPITFSAEFSFIPYKDKLEVSNFLLEKKE